METVVSQASHVSPALGLLQTLLMPSCGRRPSRILPWMRRRRDSWFMVASRVAAARQCGRVDSSTERRPVRLRWTRRVTIMAKPRPEKKPEPAAPGTTRILPIQRQLGDRVTDATGEWEVITRPYVSAGGKLASAHVRKIGRPETTALRTWSAHERIAVKRGAA